MNSTAYHAGYHFMISFFDFANLCEHKDWDDLWPTYCMGDEL